MRLAIIDLGTNTFHLLIAEVERDGSWKRLLRKRITVRLGKGGINKNLITPASYTRGVTALQQFRKYIDQYHVKSIHTFGTAALRNASNGKDFLKEIKSKFGIQVNVISGDEEAKLIYLGTRQAVTIGIIPALIMDIGGGSVEFIIANDNKIFWRKSYKLGAALLLEKFQPSDPVTPKEIKNIRKFAESELHSLFESCKKYSPQQLIGSAGSFETFASMISHKFPGSGSHYGKTEHPIEIKKFDQLYKELIFSTSAKRKTMKGLIKMRVDMIVLAALLLNIVLKNTRLNTIMLSSYSLKEGALYSIINKSKKNRIA